MGAGREASRRQARLVTRPSAALASFVTQSRWEDVPREVRREARRGLLNFAGCMLAGRAEPEIALLRRSFPQDDALADAAAATAHDYDDTHLRTVIHATPPVGAALFALAKKSNFSGRELLHAFALGVETTCRMGNAVMPGHYERGWHITGTCGVFGSAVASAKILGLNTQEIVSCLGIAATQSAGLVEVLGSMARVLNAGFAARNGIAAARLAAEGFLGPERPLEGLRGFVNVFGGSQDLASLTEGLGRRWELLNVSYKPYPCGVVLHALIDGCLEHREELRGAQNLVVSLNPLAIERTDRPEPRNAIEARLSAQHAVAVALLHGRAGLQEFSAQAANDPEIQAFRRRVRVIPDDRLDKMSAVIDSGNATFRMPAAKPMDDARLEAKFRALAGQRAGEWQRWVDSLESMEKVFLPECR